MRPRSRPCAKGRDFFRRVFVSLLLDYSHAIGPFSLDFWSLGLSFGQQWPSMVYPDTRSTRYGRDALGSAYSCARKRDAGKESRIILFSTLRSF